MDPPATKRTPAGHRIPLEIILQIITDAAKSAFDDYVWPRERPAYKNAGFLAFHTLMKPMPGSTAKGYLHRISNLSTISLRIRKHVVEVVSAHIAYFDAKCIGAYRAHTMHRLYDCGRSSLWSPPDHCMACGKLVEDAEYWKKVVADLENILKKVGFNRT